MKQLNQNLKNIFRESGFIVDQLILTCLIIRHDLNLQINTDHLVWLSSKGHLTKRQGKLVLLIPIYQDDLSEQENLSNGISDIDVDKFRKLFKGIRLGSMGNKNTVKEYLERFVIEYNISMEQILDTVENYIGMSDQRYIHNADNFIYCFKNNKEVSPLAMLLEEGEQNINKLKLIHDD